ncbi:MAG: vitamin K epoxide reductase family protein [Hydrococcus sp. C42_A2020_068]|uniref:vitamin K epoxide reductase family protein n=1 Tax=Pleurocapsa sp. PCC 7327 TaxID=118163 RepID=UPI00029FB39B|nr:vitamin K epoxide reductase family protein [Pleurocapsa sp. PCC 7327]AFY79455.1 putative membrane protein [Pleurocapsa sp. PCC 7327]MBF2021030.1 vitamin K epoxide reductase family protein [Hydrococcus sp. C42_A2020_068]
MSRRRTLPWIHRWSRPIIGAIAIVGAILTAYLTITKLTGGDVACTAEAAQAAGGCKDVLDSAYAYPFGRSGPPLSLFGSLAYIGMATFALSPLFVSPETNKGLRKQLEDWTWLLLLIGATAMTVFSGYLMFILATELKTPCPYCIGSAIFSLSLLVLTIVGREWEELGQIVFTAIIVGTITIVGTLAVYANVDTLPTAQGGRIPIPQAKTNPQPPYGWKITTTSGEAEIALAKHLKAIGAKEYGAFWCPHCYEQKQLLGQEAFQEINYIECDPQGNNPQPQACADAKIQSFPTWEINGKMHQGVKLPEELAELSGYQGPTNFKYTMLGR